MPLPGVELRLARSDEREDLATLVNTAYGRTEEPAGWTSEGHLIEGPRVTEEEIDEILQDPRSSMLVATHGSQTVGCVRLQATDEGGCKLGMLSVSPEVQAQGVGRWLLAKAEAYAWDEMGCDRMVLHVLTAREELFPWYERQGYESTGEEIPLHLEGEQRSRAGSLFLRVLEKPLVER